MNTSSSPQIVRCFATKKKRNRWLPWGATLVIATAAMGADAGQPKGTPASGWTSVPLGGGGYVTGLVCDVSGTDVYCRTDVGGAFRWNAGQNRWESVTDLMVAVSDPESASVSGITAMAVDPSDAKRLYVAAGHGKGLQGIYASEDRGTAWTRINDATPITMLGNGNFRKLGERLAVDPNHPGILWYGSSQTGLYQGVKNGPGWTWRQIPESSVPFGKVTSGENAGVTFVACDPNNGKTIVYAGVYDAVGSTGGVYMNSGGNEWSKVPGVPLSTPMRGVVARDTGDLFVTGGDAGVAKLTRGGKLALLSGLPQEIHYRGVTTNAKGNIVFVAEGNSRKQNNNIWRSSDGGLTWSQQTKVNNPPGVRGERDGTPSLTGYWFGAISSLLLSPANPNDLWVGDYFGVAYTPEAQALGTPKGCPWYMLQNGQEETVILDLKNAPKGARLIAGVGDVGGFRYLDTTTRPTGKGGGPLTNPASGNDVCLDFCESQPDFWVRAWDKGPNEGSGAVSNDGGAHWIAFGGIDVKALKNSASDETARWDLGTYLTQQKAKGAREITLVVAGYKANNNGDLMKFDSKEAGETSVRPRLVINGTKTLEPVADTFAKKSAPKANYGSAPELAIGYAWGAVSRIFLKFDLSGIDSISSASLEMNRKSSQNSAEFTVGVYACSNTEWVEGNSEGGSAGALTWANMPQTLASPTDPIARPKYIVGPAQLRGGRIAVSATNPNLLVWMPEGTKNSAYFSSDRGVTWSPCEGAPSSQMINLYAPGILIRQLVADRVNGKFYAVHFSAGNGSDVIYTSTDGGATFAVTGTLTGGAYNCYRSQIAAAPGVADDVWIADDGVSSNKKGGLWHSKDGGVTWPKLPELTAVSQVAFGAPKPGSNQPYTVFINGYKNGARGIYRSDDQGANWVKLDDAPTATAITVLAGDRQTYGNVYLGTAGRGIFQGH